MTGKERVIVKTEQTNTLGLAGFILSVVGFFSCGVTSILGFVLSFLGLFQKPRGFAVAGVLLGLPGLLIFVLFGFAAVMALFGIASAVDASEVHVGMQNAAARIQEVYSENRQASDGELRDAIEGDEDPWGTQIVFRRDGRQFTLRSAGPDGEFDTDDDQTQSHTLGGSLDRETVPEDVEDGR